MLLFKLSESASTAAQGINLTSSRLNQKVVVANLTLAAKSVEYIGGMCTDNSGNIFVTDTMNHVIVKVTESGDVSILAGESGTSGNNSGLQNVSLGNARFNQPMGIACDNSGTLYVADRGNNQIRSISNNRVSVFAGNGGRLSGLVDAARDPLQSRFSHPSDVAVTPSGVVYVADTDNNAIRKIWGGRVLTIAGGGAPADAEDVRASNAIPFCNGPESLAVDRNGTVFVCDTGNNKIKKITQAGWVYLHSGSGDSGTSLALGESDAAYKCEYAGLRYIACDRNGYQYVVDDNGTDSRLVKIDPNGVPANVSVFADALEANEFVEGVAVSPAAKVFVSVNVTEEESSSE